MIKIDALNSTDQKNDHYSILVRLLPWLWFDQIGCHWYCDHNRLDVYVFQQSEINICKHDAEKFEARGLSSYIKSKLDYGINEQICQIGKKIADLNYRRWKGIKSVWSPYSTWKNRHNKFDFANIQKSHMQPQTQDGNVKLKTMG